MGTPFFVYVGFLILLVTLISLINYKKSPNRKTDQQVNDIMSDVQKGVTQKSYQEHLNFMFQLGIISSIEYTQYLNDGLPFAKRNRQ